MGGVVEDVGHFFGTPVGRGIAGALTGGTSEISRTASQTATHNVQGPIGDLVGTAASSSLGGTAGDTLGRAAPATAQSMKQGGHVGDVVLAGSTGNVDTVKGQTAEADAAEAQAAALQQKQTADAKQAALDLAARTQTPQEALDAQRRAQISASQFIGGKRRASQYLAGGL